MEEYITDITQGILTLVKRKPTINDEATLTANQYFVLVFYVTNSSYVRNYVQFRGDHIYNAADRCYYLSINKQGIEHGYYISKSFNKIKQDLKGRVMTVTVNDYSNCVLMD